MNARKPVTPKVRCAVYTRKSTDEGLEMEFNTLGGHVPLGYEVRERKLVILPGEAETVRFIFRRFLEGGSATLLVKELAEAGAVGKNGKPMDKGATSTASWPTASTWGKSSWEPRSFPASTRRSSTGRPGRGYARSSPPTPPAGTTTGCRVPPCSRGSSAAATATGP